jgi:anti-sigma-K factor RskA
MRLNPLVEALPPVEPPPEIWRKIERRIARPPAPSGRWAAEIWAELWHSLGFWRGFGLAAGAVALLLAIYLGERPPMGGHEPVAVLEDTGGRAAWLVAAEPRARRLSVRLVAAERAPAGRVYELWLLPKGGAKPRPLGLLPAEGPAALELAPEDAAALAGADGLAISLEPAGGSPTGLPTGPVLFKGAVLAAR